MTASSDFSTTELRVEALAKRIGTFTLQADFMLGPGERAALVGRSGSGKTTLLRLLAGLEAPDLGRIRLGKREITMLPPQKREIGMVFQDQALFPGLDVLENVTFGLRMKGVSRKEREALALPWLEKVGLLDRARFPVERLSGGEGQRVAFVRAILWRPKLLLLDEPFSALDAELRGVLRRELVELHQLWPVPLLLVTHDVQDLEAIATVRLELHESRGGEIRSVRRLSPQS
ncbi:MAG: ATP-binding cassette domain-containing protein [Oligoflexia bacterium]|nr:ATP-binding cassette domain-containing protein [Oligoflexia bacterium]